MNQPIIVQGSLEHPMGSVLETNMVTRIGFHNDFDDPGGSGGGRLPH